MNNDINTNDTEFLIQKITELNTFIEYLILYMMKKNIIDKSDFFKSMQGGIDETLSDSESMPKNSKRDKLEAIIFKDSVFNFNNGGES